MDLTKCVGAPLIASLPHLLGAEEKYLKMVDGLHPNEVIIIFVIIFNLINIHSVYFIHVTCYKFKRKM